MSFGPRAVEMAATCFGPERLLFGSDCPIFDAAGMRAATVSTGGDDSHAAARRAYEKAGFSARIPSVWLCRTL